MKHTATPRTDLPAKIPPKQAHRFNQMFNEQAQRVRGLWERNDTYYAQLKTAGWTGQVALEHAQTVPQAVAVRQALKSEIETGRSLPPAQNPGRESKTE